MDQAGFMPRKFLIQGEFARSIASLVKGGVTLSHKSVWSGVVHYRCRANMTHVRQSRPDFGLGFQVKVSQASRTFKVLLKSPQELLRCSLLARKWTRRVALLALCCVTPHDATRGLKSTFEFLTRDCKRSTSIVHVSFFV